MRSTALVATVSRTKDLPSNKLPDTALNRLQNIDNKTCPLSNLLIRKSKAF